MKFEFSVYGRIIITEYVFHFLSGNMSSDEAALSFEIEDKIGLTEEEEDQVGYEKVVTKTGMSWDYDESEEYDTEVQLEEEEARLIRNGFRIVDRQGRVLRDRRYLALEDIFENQIEYTDG